MTLDAAVFSISSFETFAFTRTIGAPIILYVTL